MPLDVPLSSEIESPPALSVDLLESDSVIDLLQASANDDSFFCLTDDVPLFNPTGMLQPMIPPITTPNIRDVVRQDALIGSYFQHSLNANTDVTYVTQYKTSSALPEAPPVVADDAIISSLSQDISPLTQHIFAKPVPPPIRTTKICQRTNPKTTNQYVINPLVASQKNVVKNIQIRSEIPNTQTPLIKTGVHSHVKSPARISVVRKTSRPLSNRSKHQSFLLISRPENALPSTRIGSVKCVTHTVTRTANTVTQSPLSFTSETNTTKAQTVARRFVDAWSSLTTTAQNPKTTNMHLLCSVTSTITTQTVSKARVAASMVPTQTTFALPIYPSPVIKERPPSPSDRDIFTTKSRTSSKQGNDCTQISSEMMTLPCTKSMNPGTSPYLTSESLGIVSPTSISRGAAKNRVCAMRAALTASRTNAHSLTQTIASTIRRPYAVVPTRSTCAIPPGATLYAPTTTPSGKTSRLQAVPVTTGCQTFAIDNGMGSYTTLTISPDITQTTTQNPVTTPQSSANSKPGAESDSPVRSRSQLFIPIASTSTGISYLMTSTISSLPEVTQAPSSAALVGTHVKSDVPNRTRTRFILPVAQNVANTMVGLRSPLDSNRSRNALAIISPQISSKLDTSGNTGIGTIRAFAIAKPQNASSFLASNSERIARSQGTPTLTESSGGADSEDLSSLTALLTSDLASSTTKSTESNRPVSRIFMPFIQSASNTHTTVSAGSITSHVTTRILTPSTYILTSGMGTANTASGSQKPSQTVVIPFIHSVTTATTTTARSFTTEFTSSMIGTTDGTSRLRNRLLVPTVPTVPIVSAAVDNDCADNSSTGTSSITAFSITRSRTPISSVPMQSGLSRSSESFNPSTTHNMFAANTAFISLATTTVASTVTSKSHSSPAPTASSGDLPSSNPLCLITTATPTLTSSGHRYVIKLAASQSATSPSTSTVTVSTSTPITTSTVGPLQHQFLEPPSASRLRTFPGPRTYSIAQRNVSRSERNPSPRPTQPKRIITAPAPLQIFPEIVCPQTMSTSTQNLGQAGHRFTLSQSAGSSTLIVPQYKNTVFKNLSTIAHPIPSATRLPNVQASAERFILKRSVTCVTPRRSFPSTPVVPPRSPQRSHPRSQHSPGGAPTAASQPAPTAIPANASDDVPPPDEQFNENA